MHHSYRSGLAAVVAVAFVLAAVPAPAALSPGKVKKMKEEATDVVSVTITKSTVTSSQLKLGYKRKEITYEAVVTGVTRSTSGTNMGDRISIRSYRLSGLLPPGPANPPLLTKGWKGTIYLNQVEGDQQFQIAVFGHSFEPEDQEATSEAGG